MDLSKILPSQCMLRGMGHDDISRVIEKDVPINTGRRHIERLVGDIVRETRSFYASPRPRGYGKRHALNYEEMAGELLEELNESLIIARREGFTPVIKLVLGSRGTARGIKIGTHPNTTQELIARVRREEECDYADYDRKEGILWVGKLLPEFSKAYSVGF
jgi:hypothetical protein